MTSVTIVGGKGGNSPEITERGELVTGDLAFSEVYPAETAADNVAVNLVKPKTGKCFVITAITMSTDRSVATGGAVVQIYENDTGPTESTITKLIIKQDIPRQGQFVLPGIKLITGEGRWINLIASDTTAFADVLGYYVDA
jgi:hypothetical protein